MNKPVIDLCDDDFGLILNCAVRYALGRETYVPDSVTDFIRPLLPHLNNRTVKVMWDDVRSAEYYGNELIDKPTWMRFLNDLVKELDRREDELYEKTKSSVECMEE